ncbi:hypothetical protein A2363_05310 [Candidatus Gottesmanbacteria bacterium RIFOXYB1_FULL_47_11]|uniref:Twin-arginine translocation signal domain-containing protein n=1 Tax=Candidatus Gottesmanbacteria bacterium RIFOXYB1_FULL_47_11 TaxID=1798401 RepID=A0A1F6BD56_9BACT|nr:MAG: hypothetical protein A2363_05310 [Candidatus Gottesmanbacteria bacterium RIFOXYB1_FULL_47_11]
MVGDSENYPLPKNRISRRDFLKLGGLVAGVSAFELMRSYFANKGFVSLNPEQQKTFSPIPFFENQGIRLKHGEIETAKKKIHVYNGLSAPLKLDKIDKTYRHFEILNLAPTLFKLTSDSKNAEVQFSQISWQHKGDLIFVPAGVGLPEEYKQFVNNNAFTHPYKDHFVTVIRIPESYPYNFTLREGLQLSLITEAVQASMFVELKGSYDIGLSHGEERVLTQEALANAQGLTYILRSQGYEYDRNMFTSAELPWKASNGVTYQLKPFDLGRQNYTSLPMTPCI